MNPAGHSDDSGRSTGAVDSRPAGGTAAQSVSGMVRMEAGAGGTIYTCPMHPEVRQNGPGRCPKCGMTLQPVLTSAEQADESDGEQDGEYRTLMRKFRFAAIVALLVMGLSYPDLIPGLRDWMPAGSQARQWVWGILGLLSLPAMMWSGSQLFTGMWSGLRQRSANMHTLIAT